MFGFDDILIGAGIGALGSALFGQNPLKGAALGGVTGGLLGGLPAGSWGGGAAKALSTTPSSMGIQLAPAVADDMALSILPQAISPVPIGLGVDLSAAPVGAGISDLGAYATGAGTDIMAKNPSLLSSISPYMDVKNLSGAASIYDKFNQPRKMSTPQGGSITRGQAPQGTDVLSLIKATQIPERKRLTLI